MHRMPATANVYRLSIGEDPAESQKPVLQFVEPFRGSYDSEATVEPSGLKDR
jgi:hypothetical protein